MCALSFIFLSFSTHIITASSLPHCPSLIAFLIIGSSDVCFFWIFVESYNLLSKVFSFFFYFFKLMKSMPTIRDNILYE